MSIRVDAPGVIGTSWSSPSRYRESSQPRVIATAAAGSVADVAAPVPAYLAGSTSSNDGVTVVHCAETFDHSRNVGRPNSRTSRFNAGEVNARYGPTAY